MLKHRKYQILPQNSRRQIQMQQLISLRYIQPQRQLLLLRHPLLRNRQKTQIQTLHMLRLRPEQINQRADLFRGKVVPGEIVFCDGFVEFDDR